MYDAAKITFKLGWVLLKTEMSKHGSAKMLRELGGEEAEKVLLQKIGKYWNQQSYFDRPDGLVVVTNHRLVFLAKLKSMLMTTDYLSFPLELVENVEATRVMMVSPAIAFTVTGIDYKFTFFSGATEVVETVNAAKQALLASGMNTDQTESASDSGSGQGSNGCAVLLAVATAIAATTVAAAFGFIG